MAIANPLVLTLGGSGGTTKSLSKINQDSYGSEYFLREATQEFRVRIRHSRETPAAGALALERHNFEITQTIFGVAGAPDTVRQVYMILRSSKGDTLAEVVDLGEALSYYLDGTHYGDLVGWVN